MAYRIQYGQEVRIPRLKKHSSLRLQTMTAVCFLIFALAVKLSWAEGAKKLQEYLLPGEMTTAQTAFLGFVEDVREGEQVGQALETFCRVIMDNG